MRAQWLLLAVVGAGATQFAGDAERRVYFSLLDLLRRELGLPSPGMRRRLPQVEVQECSLHGNASNCAIADMRRTQTTLVESGGETRCIFDHSTPYAFQVVPGDRDNLLFFFQGGGVCYDELTTEAGLCSTDAVPVVPPQGMLDTTAPGNPYQNFTVVVVLYCSGDVHTGDVVRDYEVDGSSVVQAGQKNTQAVLDWVSEQQRNGGLAAQLSELIIAGDSAGSLAAQVWAAVVADTLPATAVQVIPDSFVGVFPPAAGPIIRGFGVCGWFESETLNTKCRRGTLTQQEITLDTFERLGPDVPMLFVNAKSDWVQRAFYELIVLGYGGTIVDQLSSKEFYDECNVILESYVPYNCAAFWISTTFHTYTNHQRFYSTSIFGAYTVAEESTEEFLSDWISRLEEDRIVCEDCAGQPQNVSESSSMQYCDAQLAENCATMPAGAYERPR